jgi:hypothetical protein
LAAFATALCAGTFMLAAVENSVVGASTEPSSALPSHERAALAKAHAFAADPEQFLLLGDSVALTLGEGLSSQSVARYGVLIHNEATLGCELDDLPVVLSGSIGPATPGCLQWRTAWPAEVAQVRPEVVGLLIGRWEVSDHWYGGQWVHIGDPAWDDHLEVELGQAIDLLSAGGARVVLFTTPFVDPPNRQPDGVPFPENEPARTTAYNALLQRVADAHRRTVTLVDLNHLLDPSGHYQETIGATTVRWTDGVHITIAAGQMLQPSILPTVAGLGLRARPAVTRRVLGSRAEPSVTRPASQAEG